MLNPERLARGATTACAVLLAAGLAACGERLSDTTAKGPTASEPSPSSVVVGQAPANPSGDPPGTTPVAPNTSDISKREEATDKPQEGDNHSYSTVAPTTPQKADGQNTTGNGGNAK